MKDVVEEKDLANDLNRIFSEAMALTSIQMCGLSDTKEAWERKLSGNLRLLLDIQGKGVTLETLETRLSPQALAARVRFTKGDFSHSPLNMSVNL